MRWLQSLIGLRRRNEFDVLPTIVKCGESNPNKEAVVDYTITESSMGNPVSIDATTEQYCVYCQHFADPEFRDRSFPDGGGYCGQWNGAVGFKDSCKRWEATSQVNYWLSERYIRAEGNIVDWWHVFDDGS